EETVLVLAIGEAMPTALQLGAFRLADFHVLKVSLELRFVDGRAHVHGFVKAIADLQRLGPLDVAVHELAIDTLLYDDAAGRSAALASGAESAPQSAVDREFEVGVIENDHGVLAAEFE